MEKTAIETFCPASVQEWRRWLKKNHRSKPAVWLMLYKKDSDKPVIRWSDAVDEALCFGWVDSKRKPLDEEKFLQFFSLRKPRGTWSKINKEKVKQLIGEGRMTEAGMASVELAKKNGSWSILDAVEKLTIPKDLAAAFKKEPGSKSYFKRLSKSVRKMMLQWLVLARRPETRQKRIDEIARLAAKHQKPKQFQ
ncbi:MAG TPA: YdeI/OmpD-associated family protein [Ohtaekwangia sp.]